MKKQHYYLTIISDKEIEPKEILFAISEVRPNWGKMSASCAIPNIKLAAMQARIDDIPAYEAEITRLRERADKRTDQIIELQARIKKLEAHIQESIYNCEICHGSVDCARCKTFEKDLKGE